jgi:hypothetical protein
MRRSLPKAGAAFIAAMIGLTPLARAADPTTADCLAASEASLKAGNAHRLRAERNQLLICSASSCPTDIHKECLRRIDEVNASIPTVIFQAKDGAGNDLVAVKVTMDGEVITERLEGTALSIDPGQHTFTFEAAGLPPLSKQFVIPEGQRDQHKAVVIDEASTSPASSSSTFPPPASAPSAAMQPASAPGEPPSPGGLSPRKIGAIAVGAVGVIGVGVGTIFGIEAISQKNKANASCPGVCSSASDASLWSTAQTSGNIATAGFIVGALGLAGAAAIWLFVPEGSSTGQPQVGLGLGTIGAKGTW